MAENILFQEYGVQDYIDIARQAAEWTDNYEGRKPPYSVLGTATL